jgi:hypothetical protein
VAAAAEAIDANAPQQHRPSTEPPDPASATVVTPRDELGASSPRDFEEDVVVADDLAEMIDVDDGEIAVTFEEPPAPEPSADPPSKKKRRKRSLPPPVPRGS